MSTTTVRLSAQPIIGVTRNPLRPRVAQSACTFRATHRFGQLAGPVTKRASHVAQFKLATAAELNKRQADLATRKRYLTNFWYAASFSNKISHKKPDFTFLLDTQVIIWRDDHTQEVVCITATDPATMEAISVKDAYLTVYTTAEGKRETAMCAYLPLIPAVHLQH
jgi:hypothetical protein